MILVATDYVGLRQAALEIFEEIFTAEDRERTLAAAESAANRDEIIERAIPQRTLSPGYYERVIYLLDLEEMTQVVQVGLREVDESEIRGITVVRQAREETLQKYPPCPHCGKRNSKFMPRCRACAKPLEN